MPLLSERRLLAVEDGAGDDNDDDEEEEEEVEEKGTTPAIFKGKKDTTKAKATKSKKAKAKDTNLDNASGKFDPVKDAGWKKGKPVPYLVLAETFAKIEDTSSRLEVIDYVSRTLRSIIALNPDTLLPALYLSINCIAPAYENLEMGVGDFVLLKAIADCTGTKLQSLKTKFKEIGDIGFVAEQSKANQKTMFPPPPLTVMGVFQNMKKIGSLSGRKVGDQKKAIIQRMLVSCRGPEARFIARAMQGNLRIGFAEKSMLAALGRAVTFTPLNVTPPVYNARSTMSKSKFEEEMEQNCDIIKQAFTEVPNLDLVVKSMMDHGVKALPNQCFLTPGIPIKVMLGKPAKNIQEVLKTFAGALFTIEFKYDGERAQIHLLPDGSFKIYSRNSENNTGKYPDLIKMLPNTYTKDTKSFIIDCEVVAWDRKEGKILPFQTLSTRKRKDAKEDEISVQVCLFAFDLLYYNGQSFLDEPFSTRRKQLHDAFTPLDGSFHYASFKNTAKFEDIESYMNLAIKSSCEGLMVKALDTNAGYVPNKRNWIKVKKDYLDGLGDTLDLVPIAAFYGKGKRTGVYGAYLLACLDEDSEEYQSICKIGTGFSDENLTKFTNDLKPHVIDDAPNYYLYPETMKPDVWFEPTVTWEVLCADLSVSPVHKAAVGMVHESKGIALRFPRFVRERPDKRPEEATNSEQVAEMYQNQSVVS